MRRVLPTLLAASLLILAPPSTALALEMRLDGLGSLLPDGRPELDIPAYEAFLQAVGNLATPLPVASAGSLGSLGLEASVGLDMALLDAGSPAWTRTTTDAPSSVQMLVLGGRKGLPWGLEVGGRLAHPLASGMWSLALDAKIALVAGIARAPDVVFISSVGTTTGVAALTHGHASFGALVSKDFAMGSVRLAPIAGFQTILSRGSTRGLAVFHATTGKKTQFVLPTRMIADYRGVAGARVISGPLQVTAQASLLGTVQHISLELGLRY